MPSTSCRLGHRARHPHHRSRRPARRRYPMPGSEGDDDEYEISLGRVDATAPFHGLSSLILRFPPNFVRQLSTKAQRNCSNIGVAQIVAASWSNNNSNSGILAAPSATAVDAAATAAIPVDLAKLSAGGDKVVFENDVQLEALPDLKEASFLSSDGSLAIHAGERLGRGIVTDAITTPVVNTSAYFFKKTADLIDFKEKRATSFEYGRYGNPTTVVVEEKISVLEGAESTMILASGMCASTVMLMALVPAGGHIVTTICETAECGEQVQIVGDTTTIG
ncbi:unnamed protein product [Prunus armeniaca]|uniref:Cystathionine gamma-synthase n=1 Tax=Prunus armeniaca TaxID=36596 RepID=A0A6J5Y0I8_PRUAR|nr:unnamed protein product [Prunus armeniaca]